MRRYMRLPIKQFTLITLITSFNPNNPNLGGGEGIFSHPSGFPLTTEKW